MMQDSLTALSIIIVSYNTEALLKEALQSIQTFVQPYVDTQVIVVDNASTDGSPQMVEFSFPYVKLLQNVENVGFAGANNQGLALATGDYVLLFNSDAFLTDNSLIHLLEYMRVNQEAGICGPLLLNADRSWQGGYGRIPSVKKAARFAFGLSTALNSWHRYQWAKYGNKRGLFSKPFKVGFIAGTSMVIRRAVINQIGGLDERFFMYVEDAEYCHRARRHGWQVVCVPSANVVHLGGQSGGAANLKQEYQYTRDSQKLFFQQHAGSYRWYIFSLLMVLGHSVRFCTCKTVSLASRSKGGSRCRKAWYGLSEYWQGIRH